jgi:DNA-binding PadR family transcriptional regulator
MAVREGLLALLAEGPRHGYQLKTDFEAATGGTWSLNVGQVYTTLDRLHRDGLVLVDDDDGQKRYSLTASGREELGSWWAAVPEDAPPPRDELLLKILLAVEDGTDHALDVLTRHRTALTGLLQRRRRDARAHAEGNGSLASVLVADALAVRAEADLRWLDLCESRLLRPAPKPTTPNGALDG